MLEEIQDNVKEETKKPKKKEKVKVKKLTKKQQQIIEIADNTVLPDNYSVVWTEEQLDEMCSLMEKEEFLAVDTETTGLNVFADHIVGFSVWLPNCNRGYYIPIEHVDDIKELPSPDGGRIGYDYVKCLSKEIIVNKVKPVLEDDRKKLILHNAKYDAHILYNWLGINIIENVYFDTATASALLDENRPKNLKELSAIYLKESADRFTTLFGKELFHNIPILLKAGRKGCLAGYYAVKDTYMTWKLYEFFNKAFNRTGLENIKKLFFEMEMPIIPIVWRAEQKGVKFDTEYMVKEVAPALYSELGVCYKCGGYYSINNSITPKKKNGTYATSFYFCECDKEQHEDGIVQKIWRSTGEFNVKSNPQLAEILFKQLKFPSIDKKKPYAADKKTLKKIKAVLKEKGQNTDAELCDLIAQFRAESKLVDAFADKLPKSVVNGRVHTSFNPSGTRTLRFSCARPNIQQMPSKTGGLIRRAFMADEGRLLLSVDFNGQELRILAHVSNCPVLKDIYENDGDVHSMTSVGIYNRLYNDKVNYEYFQYCRSLLDLFLDKDGKMDESKLSIRNIKKLFKSGQINTDNIEIVRNDVEKGIIFEKVRKLYGKPIGFGIIYGITEIGISNNLGVTEEEAIQMIATFMETYPGVAKWIKEQQQFIYKNKYSLSVCGGKRRLYEKIDSGQRWKIESAYRQGVNAVIQRSAAEMTKLASIKLQPLLKELDSQIVLWIHDKYLSCINLVNCWKPLKPVVLQHSL
jgi:DNA polymerase I